MPRRTLVALAAAVALSYACYQRAETPQARYLATAMRLIDREYIEPVDRQQLFEAAIEGMLGKLDDYSGFTPRQRKQRFQESLEQKFGGVGIEITLAEGDGQLTVLTPIPGSPAFAAGIHARDAIVAIDQRSTQGFKMDDAQKLLRGEPGSKVTLSVRRAGADEPLDITIERAIIKVDSVYGDHRRADGSWVFTVPGHERIGYLRIVTFGEQTAEELKSALEKLARQGVQAAILDVRDDPGGLLEAAIDTCNLFLPPGRTIVTTRGRDRQRIRQEFLAKGPGEFAHWPLAVLVNGDSASASEIVAACLQDHGRAKVVGERSFGKGTVQNVIPLEAGHSLLRLTTASYWRPNGHNIHRLNSSAASDEWGVMPDRDCLVPLDEEQARAWRTARRSRDAVPTTPEEAGELATLPADFDPALHKAIEQVGKELQARSAT